MINLPAILLCATIVTSIVPEQIVIRSSATYSTRELWNGPDVDFTFVPVDNLVLNIQRTVATLDTSDGKPPTNKQRVIVFLTGLADLKSVSDIAVGTGLTISQAYSAVYALTSEKILLKIENDPKVARYKVVSK